MTERVWIQRVARIGLRLIVEVDGRFFLELNNRAHRQHRVEVPRETARRYYRALQREAVSPTTEAL